VWGLYGSRSIETEKSIGAANGCCLLRRNNGNRRLPRQAELASGNRRFSKFETKQRLVDKA
jgi:hypothetical protein